MNTRIALSGLSILTVLSLVGGATFAVFSDTVTSTDNTFATGNADLQIAPEGDSPGTYVGSIPGFTASNIFPGYTEDFIFWLKNNSSSVISLDVDAFFEAITMTGNAAIADNLMVSFTCRSDIDSNGSFDTTFPTAGPTSVNGWTTADMVATLGPNDSTSDGMGADEVECTMTASLSSGADNTLAGSSVEFDGKFMGEQVL